jgi:thioredoxin reductase (NADPH)
VRTHSLIIATGATAKRLHLPGEEIYWNRGMSACAVCDGAMPMFRGVELVVIGGGDTACEEATYLTKFGSHIHMLVRSGKMRASKAMQDRVLNHPKITVHWHTEAVEVLGDGLRLTGVKVRNNQTGEIREMAVGGLFYAIGHKPNTDLFKGQLELDEVGYIVTRPGSVATSVEGVFAAGDVQDHEFRQAITAAGTGCMAAMLAERWLSEHGLAQEYHVVPQSHLEPASASAVEVEPEGDSAVEEASFEQEVQDDLDFSQTCHEGSYALRRLYHESDRLLMVKYTAPTCAPCHALKLILNKVIEEFADKLHVVEIDIEKDPEIAEAGGVTCTPTVQFFKNKELVAQVVGVKPKSHYREVIQANLSEAKSA